MEDNNSKSKFSLDVGKFDEHDGCPKFHMCLDFNKGIADEQQGKLEDLGLSKENTEFTICVIARTAEGQAETVKQCIDNIFSNKDWNGHLVKPLRREITKEGGGPKLSYTSHCNGNTVVGAFKLPEQVANMELLRQQVPNLDPIAESEVNKIEFSAMIGNDFQDLMNLHENSENSYLMAFFNKLKVCLELSLNPELPDKLKEVLGPMMQMMGLPTDMIFSGVKLFKNVNCSFKFNSTDQLPPNIKKAIGKELNQVGMFLKPRKGAWKQEDHDVFDVLCNNLEKDVEVVFVVPGWARIHVSICAAKFSTWWKQNMEKQKSLQAEQQQAQAEKVVSQDLEEQGDFKMMDQ